jgi:hypothetical protein
VQLYPDELPVFDLSGHPTAGRLATPVGRGAGTKQPQAAQGNLLRDLARGVGLQDYFLLDTNLSKISQKVLA